MKAICIADIHLHPYRECSRDNGADRLADGLSAVRQSLALAQQRQSWWVMLGDLKHVKGIWHQGALNGMLALMDEFDDVSKMMIHGNHDGISGGASGLAAFKKYADVYEQPCFKVMPNKSGHHRKDSIAIWPWQPSFDQLGSFIRIARKEKADILFAHAFLSGSSVGPNEVRLENTGATSEQFGLGKNRIFKHAVFGDVHKAQSFYAGSPLALNWGELEKDKGVLFLDTDKDRIERIRIHAPRFRVVDLTTEPPEVRRDVGRVEDWAHQDFVRLVVDETFKQRDIERIQELSGARHFQVVIRRQSRSEQRTTIHTGMSHEQLLTEYMAARPLDGLDQKRLLQAGLSLLK